MPARKNAWGIYDVFTANDDGQVFIGEHADEILRVAGYSDREIASLRSSGILAARSADQAPVHRVA